MRLLVAFGWGGIVRLAGAGVALVVAAITAVGSGASETAEIVGGGPLTPAQRVFAAMLVLGALMLWDNFRLLRKLTDHSTSPRLTWSDPRAEMRANGAIHLEVWCENSGPTESVAILRGGQAWTSAGQLVMPVAMGSPINSSKISQQAHRWLVRIDSPPNVQYSTGTHDITWMFVYFDNARPNTHGYLTQETLSVEFNGVGLGVIVAPYWLDATSTNEDRYKRYWAYIKAGEKAARKAAKARGKAP